MQTPKQKEWYEKNKTRILQKRQEYRSLNKDKLKAAQAAISKEKKQEYRKRRTLKGLAQSYMKAYRQENKDRLREHNKAYTKIRALTDISYRLAIVLRKRLGKAIKNSQKIGSAVVDLGCTIVELKAYLESKFAPGMRWDNWSHRGWHIDHIRPLSSFDLSDRVQFLQANHFTNLQPLWASENLSKGSKIVLDSYTQL